MHLSCQKNDQQILKEQLAEDPVDAAQPRDGGATQDAEGEPKAFASKDSLSKEGEGTDQAEASPGLEAKETREKAQQVAALAGETANTEPEPVAGTGGAAQSEPGLAAVGAEQKTPPQSAPPAVSYGSRRFTVMTQNAATDQEAAVQTGKTAGPAPSAVTESQAPAPIDSNGGESALAATRGERLAALTIIDPAKELRIWLASGKNREEADAFLREAIDSFPDVHDRYGVEVMKSDLGALGTYYRVMTGPLKELSTASEICRRIWRDQPDAFCQVRTVD